jgi:uncharacterized metal-binding protein YceD (DUF177 family)
MADPDPARLRLSDLASRTRTPFVLEPDASARAALAGELGLVGLKKLRFTGALVPAGRRDWVLEATLGATVVQACVVTLAPVTTRIDEAVTRRFTADWHEPEGDEIEIPEDDSLEPLPDILDLSRVMTEALALALPLYPRAEGVALGEAVFTAPGVAPLTEESTRPFAALKDLKDALKKDGE